MKIDRIDVDQVDWSIGVLHGVLGSTISPDLADKVEKAIPHVRAAARAIERSQRAIERDKRRARGKKKAS